mmetsp:Transcript_19298/g.41976  ORF Transcript_19298/g.41976 Transcript_19298/m.41976 type:complete len:558 (+) Transcript_19298:178-1851(+)
MSLIPRVSGAIEKGRATNISIAKITLHTKPNWTLGRQEQEQCFVNSIANRWRYGSGCRISTNNRSVHSYRFTENKYEQLSCYATYTPSSANLNRTSAVVNQNHYLLLLRNCIRFHRFSTTTKTSNGKNEKEGTSNSNNNNNEKLPPPMPDKDAELRLAGIQATITEEYKQGNFTKALSTSQDLLKQTQQHFGYNVDHPATASAMNNVGLMQKLLGNFAEARQHYVAAMRIYASVCGRDHASYAMTLHNLGNLNKSQVHFDVSLKATERLSLVEAAMEYLEESYAVRIAELGMEHPHTVATRSAIGSTLAAQVLYQHRMVEDSSNTKDSNIIRKQYVALNPQGITQQQWRAAEEHLRESLQTSIDNPRGKQIQNNLSRKNNNNNNIRFKKNKGKKQFNKQQRIGSIGTSSSSNLSVTTLSAASAAQNLAVFLKSFAMTMEEDSPDRKQHLFEAKKLYEEVQQVRIQLLPNDHPDLYATKYSLAELLEVLAAAPSSGEEDYKEEQERQSHKEAANTLRQEIIDTYDPPGMEQEEKDSTELEEEPRRVDVIVKTTKASQN